jgi:hypothetical protein
MTKPDKPSTSMSVATYAEVAQAFIARRHYLLAGWMQALAFHQNATFWAQRIQECNDAAIECGIMNEWE